MAYIHNVVITETPTELVVPVEVDSALPIYIVPAPVHMLEADAMAAAVNYPFLINNYNEGVADVGYSDAVKTAGGAFLFGASEALYYQFRVQGYGPIVIINPWNPMTDASDVAAASVPIVNGVATISEAMTIFSSIVVQDSTGDITYVRDTDYSQAWSTDGTQVLITVLKAGTIPSSATALTIAYKKATLENFSATDIEGGINPTTNARTGIALVDEVFMRYQKVAGFVLSPGYSQDPAVAALLIGKAHILSAGAGLKAIALLDLPSGGDYNDYRKLVAWKNQNGFVDPYAFADWPCMAIGDRVFHASTALAGGYAMADARHIGLPYEQASNLPLSMTKICDETGVEIPMLSIEQANFLNENGMGTFLNFGGWRYWGDETTAFPGNTDIKDYERSVRRMFNYVENVVYRTMFQFIDRPITKFLIDRILLSANEYLNTLKARGALIGGRCEFLRADNNNQSIMSGTLYFRVRLTPPNAMRACIFDFNYDPSALEGLFD